MHFFWKCRLQSVYHFVLVPTSSANFLRSVSFLIFQCYQNNGYLWTIAFTFGRCRRSLAAVTSVKYGRGMKNLTCTFARSKIYLTEKLTNWALVPLLQVCVIYCMNVVNIPPTACASHSTWSNFRSFSGMCSNDTSKSVGHIHSL